ncbi:substrate-binding periplasmic protein [Thalassotalea sediminis]|uniref:substrate-binding periplasmic protein n=1 Tax=Thalassotalea sediminis TaxID=1759089 RepID=UPI002572C84C|nr:transporter substrate-binding domain-containing protein [Thalassotalea sediminis]
MPKKSLIVLIFLLSLTTKADTFTVVLYSGGNPPYTILENNVPKGIFVDLFSYIERHSDHRFVFKVMPVARALVAFNEGVVDIEPGISDEWRLGEKVPGVYSIGYETSTEVVVSRPKNMIEVNRPEDLLGQRVGIVRGYSYPRFDDYLTLGKIKKVENISEENLLKQLEANRLKYIFIGYKTIRYYQKHFPQYQNLEIGNIVHQSTIKMRVHPKKASFINEINRLLKQMKDNGEIERIYAKYR